MFDAGITLELNILLIIKNTLSKLCITEIISLIILIDETFSIENSPELLISCLSTELCIVCLIVIIIKIGQSAVNYKNLIMKSLKCQEVLNYLSGVYEEEPQEELQEEEEELQEEFQEELEEEEFQEERDNIINSETKYKNEHKNKENFENQVKLPIARPQHTYPKNEEELGYYLAGLIDGDGYISKEENQPTITITFHKKDTFLAYKIKSLLGYGIVRKYSSYTIYTITNREGLIKLLYLIYNKLRLIHKVNRLNKLIERYNLPLIKSIPDTSNVTLTHYLAGLLDSDGKGCKNSKSCRLGCLTIKLLKRVRGLLEKERIEVRLLARVEMNKIIGSNIINKLQTDIGGSIGLRKFSYKEIKNLGNRETKSIVWSSVSFERMYNLLMYLDRYNLCSKKYLEYLYLRKAYLLIQEKKHLTQEGIIKLTLYQKRVSELKQVK